MIFKISGQISYHQMPYHMVRLGGDHVQIGQLEGVGKQALVGEEELRLKI